MANVLKVCYILSDDGAELTINDRTGQYSVLNTGGWGAPNHDISTALTATLSTSMRASDGTFGDAVVFSVFPDLPSDIGGEVDVDATDAIDSDSFADGIYKIIYTVTGDDGGTPYTLTNTQYRSFHPSIDCCVKELSAEVAVCNCSCVELEEKFRKVSVFYRLLKAAECCGDLNSIQKYIDILTKLCTNCGCS